MHAGTEAIANRAGPTAAGTERAAKVTPYVDGMVEWIREIAGGAPDCALHTAEVAGVLPDLIKIVDDDPRRVTSFADFDSDGLGVRTTGRRRSQGDQSALQNF